MTNTLKMRVEKARKKTGWIDRTIDKLDMSSKEPGEVRLRIECIDDQLVVASAYKEALDSNWWAHILNDLQETIISAKERVLVLAESNDPNDKRESDMNLALVKVSRTILERTYREADDDDLTREKNNLLIELQTFPEDL